MPDKELLEFVAAGGVVICSDSPEEFKAVLRNFDQVAQGFQKAAQFELDYDDWYMPRRKQ